MNKSARFGLPYVLRQTAQKSGYHLQDVKAILSTFQAELKKKLTTSTNTIELKGIGMFYFEVTKSKEAYNFATKERIIIPPRHKINFLFNSILKNKVKKIPVEGHLL